MTFQLPARICVSYRRLAVSSLIALQAAVIGTTVSEFVATQPQLSNTRVAFAQGNQVLAAEEATVYIETDQGSGSGVIIDPSGFGSD
ncbi:MAG: hypothetical protein F6K00_12425 [Leptolyngbya sp. SIOISBB]|nr:hypothetical protein [Leptolyngbya sp. SIOISBB]